MLEVFMLKIKENYFILETEHTSLVLKNDGGEVVYLYYGEKLNNYCGIELYEDGWKSSILSQCGTGNHREPALGVRFSDGSRKTNLKFHRARIVPFEKIEGLPCSYGAEKSLRLEFIDAPSKLKLYVTYTAYEESDVVSVATSLYNGGKKPVYLESVPSVQLEVRGRDFSFITFDGDWASERRRHEHKIGVGKLVNESIVGSSSHHHNPFTLIERAGEVYAVNLVYSGNHRTVVESNDAGKTRLIAGISPYAFDWELLPGASFFAPEAVVAYAATEEEASLCMRRFVSEHIVRGKWKKKPRPVLVNNWEATYFDFNAEKILSLADVAAEIGAELFVLDDGWFGARDDDFRGLGDWEDHVEKTGGIGILADKIRAKGLKFGIWVEPEMVNEDSDLYRKHPEYAMKIPRREPTRMRNQIMLNLADPQVQGFVYRAIARVIEQCKAQYIKWDYNRTMTDCFDKSSHSGEYYHRYMLGLYNVLEKLTARFPNVLFESCASGGGRFDLGMLCYMPQTWTSDNTDARDRVYIQAGTAAAYPQSTMGAHVSICPNHQTQNSNSLETRFDVACGGVLGYEYDLTKLTDAEKKEISEQISFYKTHRELLQFGTQYMLGNAFEGDMSGFITVSPDKSKAISVVCLPFRRVWYHTVCTKFQGLDEKAVYAVSYRDAVGNLVKLGEASGALLCKGQFRLDTVYDTVDTKRYSNPMYTRLYLFEKVSAKRRKTNE